MEIVDVKIYTQKIKFAFIMSINLNHVIRFNTVDDNSHDRHQNACIKFISKFLEQADVAEKLEYLVIISSNTRREG